MVDIGEAMLLLLKQRFGLVLRFKVVSSSFLQFCSRCNWWHQTLVSLVLLSVPIVQNRLDYCLWFLNSQVC